MVSLADKIWKDKRIPELENLIITALAAAGGRQPWSEFTVLTDLLEAIGATASQRLEFQARYPVRPPRLPAPGTGRVTATCPITFPIRRSRVRDPPIGRDRQI
jgi:hypothetical protein